MVVETFKSNIALRIIPPGQKKKKKKGIWERRGAGSLQRLAARVEFNICDCHHTLLINYLEV